MSTARQRPSRPIILKRRHSSLKLLHRENLRSNSRKKHCKSKETDFPKNKPKKCNFCTKFATNLHQEGFAVKAAISYISYSTTAHPSYIRVNFKIWGELCLLHFHLFHELLSKKRKIKSVFSRHFHCCHILSLYLSNLKLTVCVTLPVLTSQQLKHFTPSLTAHFKTVVTARVTQASF